MLPEGKCRYIDGQIYPDGNFYVLDTQHIKHNGNELKSALNSINTDVSNKVDKETGKGLSTNDYTTAEKNKLSGIEANANNYIHPTTSGNKHIPSGGSSGKILGWSADGTAAWVDPVGGSVDTVYIGSTEYAPDANGKVALPTYPTTLPASDVYSWAKASSKPSYDADEISDANTTNKFVTSADIAAWNDASTITEITSSIEAVSGYTINSLTHVYKQGNHVFGNIVIKKSSGSFSSALTKIAKLSDSYAPKYEYTNMCGFHTSEWGFSNIGYLYMPSSTVSPASNRGAIYVIDNTATNSCVNIPIDYVI